MSCEKYLPKIQDYLDKELDAARMDEIKEHLESCIACNETYKQTKIIKQLIQTKCSIPAAPSEVASQTRQLLKERHYKPQPYFQKKRFTQFALAALTLLVFSGIYFFKAEKHDVQKQSLTQLNAQLVKDHIRLLSSKSNSWKITTSDHKRAESWLQKKSRSGIKLPRFYKSDFRLEKGGSCKVMDFPVGLVCYQCKNHRLTLFVMSSTSFANYANPSWFQTYKQGTYNQEASSDYQILYWKQNHMIYALVIEPFFKDKIEEIKEMVARELL